MAEVVGQKSHFPTFAVDFKKVGLGRPHLMRFGQELFYKNQIYAGPPPRAVSPLLDWSPAGPVPRSRTGPAGLDRALVCDRSAATGSADRRNPDTLAIRST